MKYTLRFLFFLVICIITAFLPAGAAAATSTLKCDPQKDRVWVYDSLATLDVQAKVNCTETVEVLERVNGYVKVRTQEGVEGYIPESAFSDLPAYQVKRDPTHDVGYVAKSVQAKEIAKVTAANSAFAAPGGDSADGSAQVSPVTRTRSKVTNGKKATGNSSLLPGEMAEMSPRTASSPVKNASATVAHDGPIPQPAASSPAKLIDTSSPAIPKPVAQPAEVPVTAAMSPAHSGGAAEEAEDTPGYKLESDSQNLACRSYFSAYGLTANQLKWVAQNRKKEFPGVCPAPDMTKVNYVIIFTHDVSFFGGTLPDAVHNLNGFSDFRPMTPVDNALMSESDAEKAHREYVWVFHVADGGFNPEKFSPHRAFQFTKVETNSLGSKAGPKAVEDAFRFVQSANR
jgi:uncharacterized protein YgiM (DUF1202 family)